MTAADTLTLAIKTVEGDRQNDYGTATESFTRIAAIWSAILDTKVTAAQVALCMAGLKLSRLSRTPEHKDSWVDLAGYAGLGSEMSDAETG